jgi:hypothetical protein
MVNNLSAEEIHDFIIKDFIGAWDSLAKNPDKAIGRGNFMFGRQAMNLLEYIARLCTNDPTGSMLPTYSSKLFKIEPKYFTILPAPCASTSGFVLPHMGNTSGNILLWALFDLIRHGLAHQYQQMIVDLNDGKRFFIKLTGADYEKTLNAVQSSPRHRKHLAYFVDTNDDLGLIVRPEWLFLDFESAINTSGLLRKGLQFPYLGRSSGAKFYNFTKASLESSLLNGHHAKL